MRSRRALVAVSAAQLAAGVAGNVIAVRDHRSFDISVLGWRGDPDRVARDSWLFGTGLSAPIVMLGTQALATVLLATRPSRFAARTLGVLGSAMAGGYLVEKEFRAAMSPRGWDSTLTPISALAFALTLVMGVLGLGPASAADSGQAH
jgi:hypothetical protein